MSRREPSIPPEIPGLRYLQLIGMGGFADVFLYEQVGLNRPVAVKVLLQDLGAVAQRAFENEANLMAKLSSHPSIVSIFNAGQTEDGRPFLVMEYCPPPHLSQRLKASAVSVAKSLEIGIQIAAAVEMAHRLGVLHRDIKPANILFTEYGRPALTDFGISVTTDNAQKGAGMGMSVPWAPPEQLTSGQQMGPASDVYSLAATLWTVLTKRSPFALPNGPNDYFSLAKRVRTEPVPALDRQGAPPSLEQVLKVALAKDPAMRYRSALELARALQAIQAELHLSVTPVDILETNRNQLNYPLPQDTGTQVADPIAIRPDGFVTDDAPFSGGLGTTNQDSGWSDSGKALFIAHGRGISDAGGPREFTQLPAPSPQPPAAPEPVAPVSAEPTAKPRSGIAIGIIVGAIVVALVIFGGTRMLNALPDGSHNISAEPSQTVDPQDPVSNHVSEVTELTLTPEGEQVVVNWVNPDPNDGDKYLWTVVDLSQTRPAEITDQTTITVPASPGRTCVEVQLVRADGRHSDPTRGCTP